MKRWFFRYLCILGVAAIIIVTSRAGVISMANAYTAITENNASAIVTSAGLNVVAIAIAVWAGLNIANAFDRRELLDYTSNLKETNNSIKQEIEDTKKLLFERYLEEFLLALSSSLEPQHMRITRWLSYVLHENRNLVSTDELIELTKYETVYNRIFKLAKQKTCDDAILSEASSISSSIKKSIKNMAKKTKFLHIYTFCLLNYHVFLVLRLLTKNPMWTVLSHSEMHQTSISSMFIKN